jgi:predicted nucleotidyltransferase
MKKPVVAGREIQRMVRQIVSRFHPDRIILFGSHARGDAGPDSDVDLLVVMPFLGSKLEKQLEIRLALNDIHIPKDIVVTTPEDFQWRKEIPGTIERPAAREGKVLYARPEPESFYGFEPLPARGPAISNELIDELQEDHGE